MSETLTMGDFKAQLLPSEAQELRERFAEGGPGFKMLTLEAVGGETLAAALARVQAEIPEVVKAEAVTNKDGSKRYTYADLSAVTRAILPLLGKHGLSWTTMPTLIGDRFALEYRLMHASGESLGGTYPLPAGLSPQETGSAITYARRYCLCSMTGVAPGDDDDAAEAQAAYRRVGQQQPEPTYTRMTRYEEETGLSLLRPPSVGERAGAGAELAWAAFNQALDFRDCIEEHHAWADPSDGKDSPTWAERLAERVAAEIAAISNPTQWRRVRDTLKERKIDLEYQGKFFSKLLSERAAAITESQAATADAFTALVVGTTDLDEMGELAGKIVDARMGGTISEQQFADLHALHNERLEKLHREQNQEATS